MNDVSKTIRWALWSWNPVTGCENNCGYCYARRIATRFAGTKAFPRGFEPTFRVERLIQPYELIKPSKIFVCSMGELFGPWVKKEWITEIFKVMKDCSRHTFQVLTKYPEFAGGFLDEEIPENVWIGITLTGTEKENMEGNLDCLNLLSYPPWNLKTKFISIEPFLKLIPLESLLNLVKIKLDWIILGGLSGSKKFFPPEAWIQEIEEVAGKRNIPVFEKDNLRKKNKNPRREFPSIFKQK